MEGKLGSRQVFIGLGAALAVGIAMSLFAGRAAHVAPPSAAGYVRPAVPERTVPGRVWQDPSFDPEVLRKAYPVSSRPLPPEARPSKPKITPSSGKTRRLERQLNHGEVVVN